jgi:hypothetical protein
MKHLIGYLLTGTLLLVVLSSVVLQDLLENLGSIVILDISAKTDFYDNDAG